MKRFTVIIFLLSLSTICWTQSQYWTGDGGRGMRLTVYEPRGMGLSEEEQALLPLIQSTLIGSLSSPFSAMTVFDQLNLENIIKQQNISMSGYFSDEDFIRIGHLTNAQYMVIGSVTRIANNYTLELAITNVESGERRASYPPRQVSLLALQNLSAVREASAQLLRQLGVTLTATGSLELQKAEDIIKIQAETALARGIAAQRQGTEIAAMSYFYQAAALDPTLAAAANRSSVISADIRSGNIGADVRNDIQWRNDWIARLIEFEEFFYGIINTADPPYILFYFPDDIHRGAVDSIDYRNNTAKLDFPTNLRANNAWLNSIRQAANSVFSELNTALNATGRRNAWQLANWPAQGLTRNNPFASSSQSRNYNFSIVFELVNEQNRVIGSQTIRLGPSFSLSRNNEQIDISYTENTFNTVTFNSVNANDISDKLTIRIASVNGTAPENARFPMTVLSGTQWQEYRNNSVDFLRIEYGIVRGFNGNQRQPQLHIPVEVWGQAVTAIANDAFRNDQLTSVTIPNGIISIGNNTFANNQLINVTIPNSVITIGAKAFENNRLSNITIGNGVETIGERAFFGNNPSNITIGANVTFGTLAFARNVEISYTDKDNNIRTRREDQNIGFVASYQNNGRQAGTYSASLSWRINNEKGRQAQREDERVANNKRIAFLIASPFIIAGIIGLGYILLKNLPEDNISDSTSRSVAPAPGVGYKFSW